MNAAAEAAVAAANPKNVVNSVAKAFGVLQAFTPQQPAMTVSEVAASAGLDRGTSFRLLHTLVLLGYVAEVPGRRFRLTLKCLDLGFLALSSQDLWTHAQPLLRECVPGFVDAASVGMLEGADVVYLARADRGLGRYQIDRRPGHRIPAYGAALGHAMLAWLPQQRQMAVLESAPRLKLSERTLTGLDELLARLQEVRAQGYAVSDGENAYGFRTVAVPVLDAHGQAVAGVSLTVESHRLSVEQLITTALPRAYSIAAVLTRAVHMAGGAPSLPSR